VELNKVIEEYEDKLRQVRQEEIAEEDLETFITDHITRFYVPIDEKMSVCEAVMKSAYGSEHEFKQQKYVLKILYYLCIVECYTDIQVDFTKPNESYDLLFRSNFYMRFIKYVEDDLIFFDEILSDVESDYKFNNFEPHKFFNDKLSEVGTIFETITQMAIDALSNKFDDLSDEEKESLKKLFTVSK